MGMGIAGLLQKIGVNGNAVELPHGYHTRVFSVDGSVIKVISKPELSDLTLASQLADDILRYATELERIGVQSPALQVNLVDYNGRWNLVVTSSFCGLDVSERLSRSSVEDCTKIADSILTMLRQFFLNPVQGGSLEIQAGVDPKPANFCLDGHGLHFVDCMPPRIRRSGIAIVEFPAPVSKQGYQMAYFRHFDMRGILAVLQTQLCRLRPEFRPMFRQILRQFAEEFRGNGLVCYLDEFVGSRFVTANTANRLAIIHSLRCDDMYEMRDIACQLALEDPNVARQTKVEKIFTLSHFYNDKPSVKNTEEIKTILRKFTVR